MPPRRTISYSLPALVDLPTGNVHLVPTQRLADDASAPPSAGANAGLAATSPPGWVIHDGEGVALEPALETRAAALRHMGLLTFHRASLPLTLHGPDGQPTGDRLG